MRQGYLEESSVDPVKEVTDLIQAQRGYELNSKVISGRRPECWARRSNTMIRARFLLWLLAGPALADTIVAARTIPARTILAPEDLALRADDIAGGVSDPGMLLGQEARVALYAGRPIRLSDIGPPAVVERNAVIPG